MGRGEMGAGYNLLCVFVGVDFKTKNVKYQNGRYKIQIWWEKAFINSLVES